MTLFSRKSVYLGYSRGLWEKTSRKIHFLVDFSVFQHERSKEPSAHMIEGILGSNSFALEFGIFEPSSNKSSTCQNMCLALAFFRLFQDITLPTKYNDDRNP